MNHKPPRRIRRTIAALGVTAAVVAATIVGVSPVPADAACSSLVGCGRVIASTSQTRRVQLKPRSGHCVRVETKSANTGNWYDHGVHWCGGYYKTWTIGPTGYPIAAVRIRKNRYGPTLWIGS